MARAIFQTPWRQGCFYRAVHRPVSACRGQPVGGHDQNAMAGFSFLQPDGVGGLFRELHPDRLFFWEEVETFRSLVGPNGVLSDSHRDSPPSSGGDFQAFLIRIVGAPFFQETQAEIMVGHYCPVNGSPYECTLCNTSRLSDQVTVFDFNSSSHFCHAVAAEWRKAMAYALWTIDFLATDRVSSQARVRQMRRPLSRQSTRTALSLLGSISGHGLCPTDLPRIPARHRDMSAGDAQ